MIQTWIRAIIWRIPCFSNLYAFWLYLMELRHLRYFVMAAEEANISRAAARLNVSQPAVSRQIRDLEAEWDVQLFAREPQGLRLTPAGEVALTQARDILSRALQLGEALRPFSATNRRVTLKVGFRLD